MFSRGTAAPSDRISVVRQARRGARRLHATGTENGPHIVDHRHRRDRTGRVPASAAGLPCARICESPVGRKIWTPARGGRGNTTKFITLVTDGRPNSKATTFPSMALPAPQQISTNGTFPPLSHSGDAMSDCPRYMSDQFHFSRGQLAPNFLGGFSLHLLAVAHSRRGLRTNIFNLGRFRAAPISVRLAHPMRHVAPFEPSGAFENQVMGRPTLNARQPLP